MLTFELAGFPGFVSLGQFEINYDLDLTDGEMEYENGTHGSYVGWEWMYLVDDTPTGLQEFPWTDFLNYACRWGYGASGEDETRQMVTYGMHYSYRSPAHTLDYDPGLSSKYLRDEGEGYFIDLTDFCTDMDNSMPSIAMQCKDFGGMLMTAMESLGYDAYAIRIEAKDYLNFRTNPMCSAGLDSTDEDKYRTWDFAYHLTARRSFIRKYDSSSSYLQNLIGDPHKNPAADWNMPGFWQTKVGTIIYGLTTGVGAFEILIEYLETDNSPARIGHYIE